MAKTRLLAIAMCLSLGAAAAYWNSDHRRLNTAESLLANGKVEEARAAADELLERSPKLPGVLRVLAQVDLAAGNPKAALLYAEAAAKDAGDDPKVEEVLRAAHKAVEAEADSRQVDRLLAERRTDEALALTTKLVEASPGNADHHRKLGRCHWQKRQYTLALASLDRSSELRLDPETTKELAAIRNFREHLRNAQDQIELDKFAEALAQADLALQDAIVMDGELGCQDYEVYLIKAIALKALKRSTEALSSFKRCSALADAEKLRSIAKLGEELEAEAAREDRQNKGRALLQQAEEARKQGNLARAAELLRASFLLTRHRQTASMAADLYEQLPSGALFVRELVGRENRSYPEEIAKLAVKSALDLPPGVLKSGLEGANVATISEWRRRRTMLRTLDPAAHGSNEALLRTSTIIVDVALAPPAERPAALRKTLIDAFAKPNGVELAKSTLTSPLNYRLFEWIPNDAESQKFLSEAIGLKMAKATAMCDACHGAGVVKTGMVTCGQCRGQGYRYDATIVFYPRKYGLFDDNNAYGAGERSVEKDCTIDEVEDLKKGYRSFSYNTWVSKVDRDAGYKSDLFISRKVCTMCSGKEQLVKNAPCPTCQGDKTVPVLTLSAR